MLVKLALGLGVAVAGALAAVTLQPSTYRIARTTRIAAPPAVVFGEINDLRRFNAWNPWLKVDPAVRTSYEGPAAGTGAAMAWAGDASVGEGRMTITESRPDDRVRFALEFLKPFASRADAEIRLVPEGAHTAVTWSMHGEQTFLSKAIGLVMSMDRMIGRQFERGLADLKARTELAATTPGGPR